jgi:hypothetical protein
MQPPSFVKGKHSICDEDEMRVKRKKIQIDGYHAVFVTKRQQKQENHRVVKVCWAAFPLSDPEFPP